MASSDLLELPELPGLASKPKRRKKQPTTANTADPNAAETSIGNKIGSGIGFVAGSLDKPGRAVRAVAGLLAGSPHAHAQDILSIIPFSDTAGITNPEHAVSTRQIMDDVGAPKNIEGFHPFAHPLDALLDTAGFAGDVALDPLTYATLGGSALTKGGRFLHAAGLASDVRKVAGAAVGKRVAGMATTLRDVLQPRLSDAAGQAFGRARAVAKQAKGAGVTLKSVADEPLSGLVGIGAPFRQPAVVLGTGKTAQQLAGGMDALGRAIRFGKYSPVSKIVQLFHAPAGEATSRVGQELLMPEAFERVTKGTAKARLEIADLTEKLVRLAKEYGLSEDTPAAYAKMRNILEGHAPAPPEFAPIAGQIRQLLDEGLAANQRVGVNIKRLKTRPPGTSGTATVAGQPAPPIAPANITPSPPAVPLTPADSAHAAEVAREITGNQPWYGDLHAGGDMLTDAVDRAAMRRAGINPGRAKKPKPNVAIRATEKASPPPAVPLTPADSAHAAEVAREITGNQPWYGDLHAGGDMLTDAVDRAAMRRAGINPGRAKKPKPSVAIRATEKAPPPPAVPLTPADSAHAAEVAREITGNQPWYGDLHAGGDMLTDAVDRAAMRRAGINPGRAKKPKPSVAIRATEKAPPPPAAKDAADIHGETFLGEYFPRHSAPSKTPAGTALKTFDPSGMPRQPSIKGIVGETEQLNEIIRDVHGKLASGSLTTKKQAADYIKETYGHLMPATFVAKQNGKRKIGNRFNALAGRIMKMQPEQAARGLFPNHPFVDLLAHQVHGAAARETASSLIEHLADPRTLTYAKKTAATAGDVPLAELFKNSKLDVKGALEHFARSRGLQLPEDAAEATSFLKKLGQTPVPEDLAADIARKLQKVQGPQAIEETIRGLDDATNLFKALVTGVAPAFHVRNAISGAFQNFLDDQFSPRSTKEAWDMAHGKHADLTDIPVVQQMLGERKLPATPANASDMLRLLEFSHDVVPKYGSIAGNVAGATGAGQPGKLADILDEFGGGLQGSRPFSKAEAAKKAAFIHKDVKFSPLEVRGVGGRATSRFGPAAAGEDVGHLVEALNRRAPFIHNLRKGMDAGEAARRVKAAQIDYSGRNYTNFEKQGLTAATRWMPFYKFTKGVAKHTTQQLSERPGGKLAQTIRAMQAGHGAEASTPDYVAETASIPLGTGAEGSKRYLTGFGLMPEDPLSFLGGGGTLGLPSVRTAMMEGISRLNPLIKGPTEWATGHSFFQKGPLGGRALEDMDPLIGRIAANLTGRQKAVKLPDGIEFLLANSPFSRGLSTVRTLTDPRKSLASKAANTLTGMRLSDISPAAQDAVLREKAAAAMKEVGAKSYSEVYFSKEQLAEMTPAERAKAQELMALMKQLGENAKARKKAKLVAAAP